MFQCQSTHSPSDLFSASLLSQWLIYFFPNINLNLWSHNLGSLPLDLLPGITKRSLIPSSSLLSPQTACGKLWNSSWAVSTRLNKPSFFLLSLQHMCCRSLTTSVEPSQASPALPRTGERAKLVKGEHNTLHESSAAVMGDKAPGCAQNTHTNLFLVTVHCWPTFCLSTNITTWLFSAQPATGQRIILLSLQTFAFFLMNHTNFLPNQS